MTNITKIPVRVQKKKRQGQWINSKMIVGLLYGSGENIPI